MAALAASRKPHRPLATVGAAVGAAEAGAVAQPPLAAAGAATVAAVSPELEHAAPFRPPAVAVAALAASRKVPSAAEAGISSK